MPPPITFSKSLAAASANCIALAQTVAAGANAILNGGSVVAGAFTLDTQRRIAIVSSGNDSANTAHLYGNRGTGQPINEILALTNGGTAVSTLDYISGGTITFPTGTAGNVTIGTNNTGSTNWRVPNYNLTPFDLNIFTQVSGSVTYNIEETNDAWFFDPPKNGQKSVTPQPTVTELLQGTTVGTIEAVTNPVSGYRITITAGQGTVSAQATQAGISNM